MNRLSRFGKIAFGSVVGLAAVLGAAVLVQPASAGGPRGGPMCGPTILWICSGPGGPDVLFGGTICEKAAFEQSTGLTCVPYTG